ncbi:MAG: haloacid dehalogenase [Planctomycetota bacterium]|nr:MAG: haloacid dehalogenase [Planctomycetota bacterium]
MSSGKRPLDAVFFDIDDTLFSTSVFAEKARRAAVDAMIQYGLRGIPRELALKELREVVEEFSSNYGHHFDKLLSRLPEQAIEGMNPAMLVAAGMVAYHDTKFRDLRVYDDVYDVLRRLAGTSLIRGVISAGLTVKQTEKILRLHIYEFLSPNAIFITEQIGIGKPNPKLFQRALEELDLRPERTMYVGDHPDNDIAPCKELGMIAVWNRRSGRHAEREAKVAADYEVRDFYELREILWRDFDIR